MSAKDTQREPGETAHGIRKLTERIGDHPGAALLTALAIGFVVGLLLRMVEKPPRDERRSA